MRTALVTGAGRGIGRGLARGLAAHGYDVALLGRTPEHLERVAAEIAGDAAISTATATIVARGSTADAADATGARRAPTVVVEPVELTDGPAVRAAVGRAERALGGIGLVVNNAGVIERADMPLAEDDVEDVWRVIETNLRSALLVTHAALPGMIARGDGRVVMINSGAGHKAAGDHTGYYVGKGALARLTTQVDAQVAHLGVRAFDLAPGVVPTDMTAAMPVHAGRTQWTPLEASLDLVLAIGDGVLDAWSGRFLRAGDDTVAELVARTPDVLAADGRRLRLVPYGPSDPIGA